ncbi:MAG TPA: prolyl oligopeptidase family serine peptidase [Anaeromyxobacteraceae bacterium]|nr:prolyl oligopeptidase family serine peptidase [Anaeromyxobacteraceae bacterium]
MQATPAGGEAPGRRLRGDGQEVVNADTRAVDRVYAVELADARDAGGAGRPRAGAGLPRPPHRRELPLLVGRRAGGRGRVDPLPARPVRRLDALRRLRGRCEGRAFWPGREHCARHLVARKYTSPARLGMLGGSNGGLLMGAMITQHPDLARAVVAAVGIDPRAAAWHARKMAARLQAATASGRPVLLRVSDSGHGIGSPLDERIAETADLYAFFLHELGVHWKPPPAPPER